MKTLKVISSTDGQFIGRNFKVDKVSISEADRITSGLFKFENCVMMGDRTVQFSNSNYVVTLKIL